MAAHISQNNIPCPHTIKENYPWVNVIIHIILSDLSWAKVITLSGV